MAIRLASGAARRITENLRRISSGKVRGQAARDLALATDEMLGEEVAKVAPTTRRGRQFALRLRVLNERGAILETVPPTGSVWETDYFRCAHFGGCLLEVRTCLMRQGAKWPGGNRAHKTHGPSIPKKAGVHPYCASGQCQQGKDLRARCTFRPEDVWSKGRYHTWRPDTHDQRVSMKAWERGRILEPRADMSPLSEAAAMTPNDKDVP